ncbi:hypothetical protein O6H91_06G063300 [Diphasiastrum complanatum]|uniref:Uncharacterized protein n=1 Tax=Diphasiastrum complanatum TaxID=34168 RepID=A0ACC2DEF6_DIPCM|nr:hypothetical protein O6H91_06G063300 [Diphasiastrum complanatum]
MLQQIAVPAKDSTMDETPGLADGPAIFSVEDDVLDEIFSSVEDLWDDEITFFRNPICDQEVDICEFIGDKEPISVLAVEYESGNPIFKAKIEKLASTYGAIRRIRRDGNCFFRSFMFSYLEYILEAKDAAEVARVLKSVESCKQALLGFGYAEFTFEDFFAVFVEQLEYVLPGKSSTSVDTLIERCRDLVISNYAVMFFRFATSSEIRRRADFFEPFIYGNLTVQQFCNTSVEPMGEESDHIHITALTDALGVPVRVVYLDRSGGDSGKAAEINHHDFVPAISQSSDKAAVPPVTLLYRPGHYDILYAK